MSLNQEEIKKLLGKRAAQEVQEGMVVGLGTGTTASAFIQALIVRGLKIKAVASSLRSEEEAKKGGIDVVDINSIDSIDLTVDGADEVDAKERLIKGKGGALVREKIVANASQKMIVLVDETKRVKKLGEVGLSIEVVAFGYKMTLQEMESKGYKGRLRLAQSKPFISDNGNYIIDLLPRLFAQPEEDEISLKMIPGVVETGFFFHFASEIWIGHQDGKIEVIS